MEANYSNYDRSQIKLKFKTPNKLQRDFYLFLSKGEEGKEKKMVKQYDLLVKTGVEKATHFSEGLIVENRKKKKAKIKGIGKNYS